MPSTFQQLRTAGRFARELYADRAAVVYHGARGDAFSQLRGRPGRLDPFPVYRRIRDAGGSVPTRAGNLATVDHAACSAVLRSRRFGVQAEGDAQDPEDEVDLSFLSMNPPRHTRLRRLAAGAFSPRRVAEYRDGLDRTIDRLLDDALAKGEFDLVSAYAAPLPITVITGLLGISDADTAEFTRYGAAVGGALGGIRSLRHAAELHPGRPGAGRPLRRAHRPAPRRAGG